MQKFKVADGGLANGRAVDRDGVTPGTKYFAKVWNDNLFNLFNFVEAAGYSLIDDDEEQFAKAVKGPYVNTFTYNTSAIASQTVNDVVLGSDGNYYEVQADGVSGDDPVGSVSGNWLQVSFSPVASTAEARAQTNNTKKITPLRLAEAFQGTNQSLTGNGYQKLPGGLIFQWGTNAIGTSATPIVLPITFPNAALGACAVDRGDPDKVSVTLLTTTTLTMKADTNTQPYWFAFGY